MSERSLTVMINGESLGRLYEDQGVWAFQYSATWLALPRNFALSPHLPLQQDPLRDGGSVRHVQWYFDNLLPEEQLRTLVAREAQLDAADAFSLLAWLGAESAGSLTLVSGPEAAPENQGDAQALSDEALSLRIQSLPRTSLTHGALKRMSLAGAQHKLAVILSEDNALFEPVGAQASTHILKPNHPDQTYPHSAINEWFVMQLAGALGLMVPRVHRRYVPETVFLVERFDRFREGKDWQRRHIIDACQLLGLDRSFKYTQGSMQTLAEMADACRSKAAARSRLFAWLVFNLLTGNGDAHLKNLSFLVSEEGISLAPHYDLLSTGCYESKAFNHAAWPSQSLLAWPILGVQRFAEIGRDLLIDAAASLQLNRATASRLIDYQRSRIAQAAQRLYDKFEQENRVLLAHNNDLRATIAGESRCVRAIIHGVIKDMVAQLS